MPREARELGEQRSGEAPHLLSSCRRAAARFKTPGAWAGIGPLETTASVGADDPITRAEGLLTFPMGPPLIHLVEDDVAIQTIHPDALCAHGDNVISADHRAPACATIALLQVAVIIVDVMRAGLAVETL